MKHDIKQVQSKVHQGWGRESNNSILSLQSAPTTSSHLTAPQALTWEGAPPEDIQCPEGTLPPQITEASDQPFSAHTKLLLLIQNSMLQILYSMDIYSLQKWLPNHSKGTWNKHKTEQ